MSEDDQSENLAARIRRSNAIAGAITKEKKKILQIRMPDGDDAYDLAAELGRKFQIKTGARKSERHGGWVVQIVEEEAKKAHLLPEGGLGSLPGIAPEVFIRHKPPGSYQAQGDKKHQEDRMFVRSFAPTNLRQAEDFWAQAVSAMDKATRDMDTGSTFTGAIVTEEGNVAIAHLGDSPAAMFVYDPETHDMKVTPLLVTAHKPSKTFRKRHSDCAEKDGVLYKSNPEKNRERVLPVTHALGNKFFGEDVSKIPDIRSHDVAEDHRQGKRVFLMVASDGILESRDSNGNLKVVKGEEEWLKEEEKRLREYAVKLGHKLKENPDVSMQDLSALIGDNSLLHDNTTVNMLEVTPGNPMISAVFDGHGQNIHKGKDKPIVSDVACEELQGIVRRTVNERRQNSMGR